MKKSAFPFTAVVVLSASLPLQPALHAQPGTTLTFEPVFKNAEPRITRPHPNITGWADNRHYLEMKEKEMDTPAENPEGYKEGSVLTHAHKYTGMLQIVHGTMDGNVHMQNAMQLVDTLQELNKHFEVMFYPDGRHGWGGPEAVHLRSEEYRFYYPYLLRKEFAEKPVQNPRRELYAPAEVGRQEFSFFSCFLVPKQLSY